MKFKSEHMTQASGSIAGVTYGRAKGGILYRRARAIPVNPSTMYQQQVRSALTQLVNYWTNTLTAAQRTAWDTYGANVPVTDKLGSSITLSGQNWFVACNTPLQQDVAKFGDTVAVNADAPTMYDRGDFTTPEETSISVASGFDVHFNASDGWNNAIGGWMFVYQGRPRNASRNFFKGPYRLVARIIGDDTTPPTSPANISTANLALYGYPLVLGQRITFACAVVQADGRLSTRRIFTDEVVTA